MGLFGGNWTNENYTRNDEKPELNTGLNPETGISSVPHAGKKAKMGAQLFCFFEAGDVNHPVYFAAAQAGRGWLSEYPQQHVIQTDNVSIVINEDYESVKQITEKQVATSDSDELTSEELNNLANKNAIDFIPMVYQNSYFDGFVTDNRGIIESEDGVYFDGMNFGEYKTKNTNTSTTSIQDYVNAQNDVKKSKCTLNNVIITPEEIDFYDNQMPVCNITWSYSLPSSSSNIGDIVEFYELNIGTDNNFTSIQKYRCLNASISLNTLHVGSYAARVRAWTTSSGASNWSSPQVFEIKYKTETDLKYEQDKKTRPTRVNIFIENQKGVAVNLKIHGDVALEVDGNVTEHITGDKFQNIDGSFVQNIQGGMTQTIKGPTTVINKDNFAHHIQGKRTQIVYEDNLQIDRGNYDHTIEGRKQLCVQGTYNQEVYGTKKVSVSKKYRLDVDSYICMANGSYMINSLGGCSIDSGGSVVIASGESFEVAAIQNVNMTAGVNTTIKSMMLTDILGTGVSVTSTTSYTLSCSMYVETTTATKTTTVGGAHSLTVGGVSTFTASAHIMTPLPPHIHYAIPLQFFTLDVVQ